MAGTTRICIVLLVSPEHADPGNSTGLTEEAHDTLTDPMRLPLGWLGEIESVECEGWEELKEHTGGGPKRKA